MYIMYMFIYVYVYVYVCMYVCMYVCICIYIRTCIHTYYVLDVAGYVRGASRMYGAPLEEEVKLRHTYMYIYKVLQVTGS